MLEVVDEVDAGDGRLRHILFEVDCSANKLLTFLHFTSVPPPNKTAGVLVACPAPPSIG